MHVARKYTKAGQDAYAEIEFRQATSEIKNPDGSIVFRLDTSRFRPRGARLPPISWRRSISARRAFRQS
jgi:hypothetical protein